MGLLDFLLLAVIAGLVGGMGQAIAGYSRGGCLVSVAIGFIGALLGSWLGGLLGLPDILQVHVGASRFPVIWSLVGATLFVALLGYFHRKPGGGA